jgi:hypothetical protein
VISNTTPSSGSRRSGMPPRHARVTGKGAVGKAEAMRLIGDVHDSTRCHGGEDAEAQRDKQGDPLGHARLVWQQSGLGASTRLPALDRLPATSEAALAEVLGPEAALSGVSSNPVGS